MDTAKNEEIFGLFRYSYNYYEFKDLAFVSYSKDSLVDKYNSFNNGGYPEPLVDESEHDAYANKDCVHYLIKPVTVI